MDAFLPSVLSSPADILDNPDLILTSFSSEVNTSDLSASSNLDLCLECEEDGGSTSMAPSSDLFLSHQFTDENVRLAITFPSPSSSIVTEEDTILCSLCDKTFSKEKLLFRHLKEAHGMKKNYTCDICPYAANSSRLLSRHKAAKHGISKERKSRSVSIATVSSAVKRSLNCDKIFINTNYRKNEADASSRVNCAIRKTEDNNEIVTDNSTLPNNNTALNVSIPTNSDVIPEQIIVNVNKSVQRNYLLNTNCPDINQPICGSQTAVIKQSVNIFSSDNEISENGNKVKNSYPCDACSYIAKSKRLLKYHAKTMHNPLRESFKCVQCSYTCQQKRTLDQHTAKQHGGGKSEICDKCNKTFYSSSALKRHLLIHTDKKQFVCSVNSCSKAFKTAGDLGNHRRKVHSVSQAAGDGDDAKKKGVKKYVCDFSGCGKAFRDRNNLKTHQCLHSGEKPLKCPLCSFCCVQKTSLDYHKKTHHS